MAVGAVVARILTQYSDKGSKAAQKDIAKLGKNFDDFAKKTVKAFGIAAAAVGAFAIKVGKDAVQAAIADQKSQVLLANSLRNTVGATDLAIASVEDYISNLQLQVGVADDDLRPALAKLAAVTGDVTSAQQLLGLALDVSAFSGSDLGTASAAITKALQGNFRTLQKLVPSISTATIKSKDFAAILAEVQKATQGSAAARAGTLEYKLNILRIRYGEILETLGYKLLPVIEKFADVIEKEVLPQIEKWIKKNEKGLVNSLKTVTELSIKLIKGLVAFATWISQNMGLVKALGIAIASLFVIGKIGAFIIGLQGIATAFGLITVGANGATAATLRFKKSLAFLLKGAAVLATVFAVLSLSGSSKTEGGFPAGTVGARNAKENAARMRQMKAYTKFQKGRAAQAASIAPDVSGDAGGFAKLLANLNKMNGALAKGAKIEKDQLTARQKKYNLLLKEMGIKTTEQQEAMTQFTIRANLLKQAAITGSSLTSIGSPTPMNMATAGMNNPITVNVQGSVISEKDLVSMIANELKKRTLAGNPVTGTYLGSNTDNLAFKVRYL